MLSQNLVRDLFVYENGNLYWREDRGSNKVKDTLAGSVHHSGYRQINVGGKFEFAHRIVYAYFYGDVPQFIDHVNGDKLDNRIENLRPATKMQNGANEKRRKTNMSGIKNVSWSAHFSKWHARITCNGEKYHIGYFRTLEEAAEAVKAARIELHGEFANHG